MNKRISSLLRHTWFALKILLGGILLAVVLRVFVIGSCHVPSPSMKPSVIPGDNLLVEKMTLGARISCGNNTGTDGVTRLWGIGKIQRNDVLVFNYPKSKINKEKFHSFLAFLIE